MWNTVIKNNIRKYKIVTRKKDTIHRGFICERGNCQKGFRFRTELERHLKLHDNNLLKCHFCSYATNRHDFLFDHLNHHFDIRPYPCNFCEKRFFTVDNKKKT